jgi:putative ABC transport system permease protein
MNCPRRLKFLCRALFAKARLDAEMDEEMRMHIEMQTQENIKAGMPAEEARYAAMRQFGWAEPVKETCREQRGLRWLEDLGQDIRFGLRQLRKNPAFTATAVFSLALGITSTCAVFSLVDGIWLRSMPFAEPGRVARIFAGSSSDPRGNLSLPDYLDLAGQMQSVSGLAFNDRRGAVLTGVEEREELRADVVSRNFFSVLGIRPFLGRFFSEADSPDLRKTPAVVLSHRLWHRRFGGETNLVGKPIVLTGQSVVVLGIAPAGFNGLERLSPAEVWYPGETWGGGMDNSRQGRWLSVVGRLKPGCRLEQAHVEAQTLFRRLDLRDAASHAPLNATVLTEARLQSEQAGGLSLLLLGVVGTVLLLACANVSSLLLARADARSREMAVRLALGGSRGRLVRQLLSESLLLALMAAATSLLLAGWLIQALPTLLPADMAGPVGLVIRFDGRVVAFTAALSVLTVFVFGLAPAAQATRPDVCPLLKGEASSGRRGGRRRGRNALVVGQMGLALVLVSLAGLLVRSLWACGRADLGFERKEILLVNLSADGDEEAGRLFFRQFKERLLALPGVKRASVASVVPFSPSGTGASLQAFLPNDSTPAAEAGRATRYNAVDADYFSLLGIRVLRGRGFSERDDRASPRVVVINEAMAKSFWAGADPVGQTLRLESRTNPPVRIVGVVHDSKLDGIDEKPGPYLYLPFAQHYQWETVVLVESAARARALAGPVRAQLRALGIKPARSDISSMGGYIKAALAAQTFLGQMAATFGLLGLALASVGLYGVLAYMVGRRTAEIGIRMALGAQRRDVLLMVLGQGLKLALLGAVLAVPVLVAISHVVRGFLYGVGPLDPPSLGAAGLLLLLVAILAAWLPARRATNIDPMAALRYE